MLSGFACVERVPTSNSFGVFPSFPVVGVICISIGFNVMLWVAGGLIECLEKRLECTLWKLYKPS